MNSHWGFEPPGVAALGPTACGAKIERADSYVLILATGCEDGGKRATLTFAMACTALALGAQASLFLIGDGVYWGYEGRCEQVHVSGFPPLEELVQQCLALGGEIALCSACDGACSLPQDASGGVLQRRSGVVLRGLAATLDRLAQGKAVCF